MTNLYPSLTVLLIFACLVAYEYIRDLRRDRKDLRSERDHYMRAYINADRALRDLKGLHTPVGYYGPEDKPKQEEKPADGFRPMGIGPTAIMDRERRRSQQEARDREPKFANPSVLTHRAPTAEEIAAASREATDGDHLH